MSSDEGIDPFRIRRSANGVSNVDRVEVTWFNKLRNRLKANVICVAEVLTRPAKLRNGLICCGTCSRRG